MKKLIYFFVCVILGAIPVFSLEAAEFAVPSAQNARIFIGQEQTRENLYAAGGTITVNGRIVNDLVVAGGTVDVNGQVEDDILAGGGTVSINGPVGGSVRAAGGDISVAGRVNGDVVLAGGNIYLTSQSLVAGDVALAGGSITIDAPVSGDIRITGGNVIINSQVNGSVSVRASQGLTFGPQARVQGPVAYRGPSEAVVQEGAQVGAIDFTRQEQAGRGVGKLVTLGFLIQLLAWILTGLLLVRYARVWLARVINSIREKPLENLGIGLLGLIGIPIVAIILFLLIIGYYLGIIVGLGYILLLVLTNIFAVIALGFIVIGLFNRSPERVVGWQSVVVGAILWILLSWIPIVGWIVLFILFIITLGAILRIAKRPAT